MIKIYDSASVPDEQIFFRCENISNVTDIVADIISDVRKNGDKALLNYCAKFDLCTLDCLEVTPQEINEAVTEVGEKFLTVLRKAAENIRAFHANQLRSGFIMDGNGCVMGQKVLPLERVGLYVPGGTAAYPSSVLMNAIPAKLAGVSQLCITTPPGKNGKINAYILAAAKIAGVDKIYKVGGAQAIAALAYGTETIKPVDKIVGPGNAFVAEAKRQVYGKVAIDMIAGPSEILIIADGTCDAGVVAADMLSQAEHDKMASAVLCTDSMTLAQSVAIEIEKQLKTLPREQIARVSIENNGKIIVTESIEKAIEAANRIAPEHLEICVGNPFDFLDKIKNAGSVFLGKNCPEALGDYMAGPNHTLPTGGTARFCSPLSVDDFVKKMQFTYFTEEALSAMADDVYYFAEKEGLDAHARSAVARRKKAQS